MKENIQKYFRFFRTRFNPFLPSAISWAHIESVTKHVWKDSADLSYQLLFSLCLFLTWWNNFVFQMCSCYCLTLSWWNKKIQMCSCAHAESVTEHVWKRRCLSNHPLFSFRLILASWKMLFAKCVLVVV